MRIFTVVFFFIIKEITKCYFYICQGNLLFIYHSGLDFTQYT